MTTNVGNVSAKTNYNSSKFKRKHVVMPFEQSKAERSGIQYLSDDYTKILLAKPHFVL